MDRIISVIEVDYLMLFKMNLICRQVKLSVRDRLKEVESGKYGRVKVLSTAHNLPLI